MMRIRRPNNSQLIILIFVVSSIFYNLFILNNLRRYEFVFIIAALIVFLLGLFVDEFLESPYYTGVAGGLIATYSGYLFVFDGQLMALAGVIVGLLFAVYGFVNPFADTAESASERPRRGQ